MIDRKKYKTTRTIQKIDTFRESKSNEVNRLSSFISDEQKKNNKQINRFIFKMQVFTLLSKDWISSKWSTFIGLVFMNVFAVFLFERYWKVTIHHHAYAANICIENIYVCFHLPWKRSTKVSKAQNSYKTPMLNTMIKVLWCRVYYAH